MSPPSDPRLLVLRELRLKGVVPLDGLADATGLPAADVAPVVDALAGDGFVVLRTGALAGWALTPAGRRELERLLADEVDAAGAREAVTGAYRRFGALNAGVLDVCSRWQVRDVDGRPVVNDHTDAAYDKAVIADLARIQHAADPLCDDLAAALDRYRSYGPALRRAVRRVEGGDGDWFTKPVMPSYHTVWFELHEDLLATLGLDRTSEPVS
ncbi:MAG TPA: hypothetical protein VFY82_00010 [Acidimicrobiales bacterium]|nr:hypothetical protein [Acidimicrobiales bacterium]